MKSKNMVMEFMWLEKLLAHLQINLIAVQDVIKQFQWQRHILLPG
jgi:NADH:ubiquinone oxidoreductase subunit K